METGVAAKMSEVVKDSSAIKLFGKTISVSPKQQLHSWPSTSISSVDTKDVSGRVFAWTKHEGTSISTTEEMLADATTSSGISDDNKKLPLSPETSEKEELSESSGSQEKTLKKPDKILPCPRCNSMDTKFCYFNNYNVNQPRHFCKKCQRYWTAGGTMRNVAVGSGRRKNKNVSSINYPHIIVSDADVINGIGFSSVKPNGFLVFGLDGSIDESFVRAERSSSPTSSLTETGSRADTEESRSRKLPSYPQPTWSCQWNGPGVPVMFYPPSIYWGCDVQSPWNGPWFPQTSFSLGKHAREGTTLEPSNSGKENHSARSVLIPKTSRVDDPNEAAKSSIWSALGIKNEKSCSMNGKSHFKAFAPKGNRNSNVDNASMVLQANPAALCRSLNFQESA